MKPAKRNRIYTRDDRKCVWCGFPGALTLDHLVPREAGGTNDHTNLVTCCHSCNSERRHLTVRQWMRTLRAIGYDTVEVTYNLRRARRAQI